jgi:hypothetical protein
VQLIKVATQCNVKLTEEQIGMFIEHIAAYKRKGKYVSISIDLVSKDRVSSSSQFASLIFGY